MKYREVDYNIKELEKKDGKIAPPVTLHLHRTGAKPASKLSVAAPQLNVLLMLVAVTLLHSYMKQKYKSYMQA
jgi:hypothetical protein